MNDNSRITLGSGEIYLTENADDAFFVRSGTLLIFAVTDDGDGSYGKRSFVYEAHQGEAVPGYCYTDMGYRRHRFLFSAADELTLSVIRNGSTKKLRTGFLKKIGIEMTGEESFDEVLADNLRLSRVTSDSFIKRSESLREQNAVDAERIISGGARKSADEPKADPKKDNSVKDAFRLVRLSIRAAKPVYKALFVLCVILSAVFAGVFLRFLCGALSHEAPIDLRRGALMILCMAGLTLLIAFGCVLLAGAAASRIALDAQKTLIERFFNLRYSYFRREDTASVASVLLNSYKITESIISDSFSFIGFTALSAVCLFAAFISAPMPALIGSLILAAVFTAYAVSHGKMTRRRDKRRRAAAKADSLLYQFVACVTKLRMAGAEERATLEYLRPVLARAEAGEKNHRIHIFFGSLFSSVTVLTAAVLLTGSCVLDISRSFGSVAVCVGALSLAACSAAAAVDAFARICDRQRYPRMIQSVLDSFGEEDGSDKTEVIPDGDISLEHITFTYDSDTEPQIKDLSLHIGAGEYVAVTGESGCGKSTLFKLLLGFETPQKGDILYSGVSISKLDIRTLRRHTGAVLQDGRLITGTVAENILLSKPDASKRELAAAVRAAGLEDDLYAMPMGIQTLVSGSGEMFSGGQRQKILLARALLSRPELLLLDEATSALDNIAQNTVTEMLDSLPVTRIVIAHRLSTIRKCDRIIVVKDGAIAEQGSYDELMSRNGVFRSLIERQIVS